VAHSRAKENTYLCTRSYRRGVPSKILRSSSIASHTNILVMILRPAYTYTFKRTLMLALKSSSQLRNLLHKA
jgi:hypothetical protein